ncbi:MAG: ABC transporter permease [Clostridia bacterium]|nr:ABC transporter permease [Clostridia bacterium]
MSKLLRADFVRLFRSKPFFIFCAIIAAFSVYLNIGHSVSLNTLNADYAILPFELLIYFSFAVTTAVSFFAGVNFSDGIIRNKLSSGYSKTEIYLANLTVCAVISAVFSVLYMTGGIWLVVYKKMNAATFITHILAGTAVAVSFSALGSAVTFVCRSKAVPIVVSAVIILTMCLGANLLHNKLDEPEYNREIETINGISVEGAEGFVYGNDDEVTFKTVKNDKFLPGGTKRTLLESLYRFIPAAQAIEISEVSYWSDTPDTVYRMENRGVDNFGDNAEITSPFDAFKTVDPFYCLIFQIIVTLAGIMIFRKEDLN